MPEKHTRDNPVQSDSEVWNAIAAFEKILEVMPDDRSSLETLAHAYEHIGDQVRSLAYLLRLGEIVVRENDFEAAPHLVQKLGDYGGGDQRAAALIEKLRPLVRQAAVKEEEAAEAAAAAPDEAPTPSQETPTPTPSRHVPVKFRVADELSFAWRLFEAGEISQDDYAAVAHDLSELAVDGHLSTVSVLHVLEHRAFAGMERVMGYISRESKTPIVSLLAFELAPEATSLLSNEFIIRRGSLVFGLIMDDAMVVVMNPFDRSLRADIETATGRKCHFFMALPSEFDAAVAAIPSD